MESPGIVQPRCFLRVCVRPQTVLQRHAPPPWTFDDELSCFQWANITFETALSSLYVQKFFEKKNKEKVVEIVESLKTAGEKSIRTNTWMDKETKDYAISKMKSSTYKIGYPDFMDDKTNVDAIYKNLHIDKTNFMGNTLAAVQYLREESNRRLRLRGKEDRSEWLARAYQPSMGLIYQWNEVIVPAGVLQFPFYHYDMPHYYSFGAIGNMMSQFIYRLVDYGGRIWDKEGKLMTGQNGWWSNQTMTSYNDVKQCVADVFNVTQEHHTTSIASVMSETTSIRIAYNAYKAWVKKHGTDQNPLGHNYTPEQLFFIAYAQTSCYNLEGVYDGENRVNTQLQQLPEFAEAFGCKASDKMVPTKRCLYD